MKYYLSPDDFIKIIDPEGNSNFFKVLKDEPLGQIKVPFANAANPIAPGGVSDVPRVPFDFLEPARQNRLFQIRVNIFAIDRATAVLVDIATIAPLFELEWGLPVGTVRGGSDITGNITMNGIVSNGIGGINGGRIPFNQIYTRDDLNEVFDLWLLFGTYPDFAVRNQSTFPLGGDGGPLAYDWYISIQGRKYILGDVNKEELEKILNRTQKYRGITIGGIKAITTKA